MRPTFGRVCFAAKLPRVVTTSSGTTVRMGMPKACIAKISREIPHEGFYDTLQRIGPELAGSTLKAVGALLRVFKF